MIILLYIILLVLCIIFPDLAIKTSKETIVLWYQSILPSLLPFFIISKCIYNNDGVNILSKILNPITKILGLPKTIALPLSMTLLCGYQTGSRTVANMNLKRNLNAFANICYSPSPLYVIGTVGSVILKSPSSGYALYTIQICTLLISTVFCSFKDEFIYQQKEQKESFNSIISESISSVLSICGYMILYNLIIKIITFFMPTNLNVFISGIFEFTEGIKKAVNHIEYPMPAISFFLSFGGICVITQCLSVLKGVNKIYFILNRFFLGIISFSLCILYKKTALYIPIIITIIILFLGYIFRRKKFTD